MAPAGEFDHIVTRAGSAGCAMAARSIQSGQYRVLLPVRPIAIPGFYLPTGFSRLFADPAVNWMYESEPEPQLAGRSMYSPLGKVLGPHQIDRQRGLYAWQSRGLPGWGERISRCGRTSDGNRSTEQLRTRGKSDRDDAGRCARDGVIT